MPADPRAVTATTPGVTMIALLTVLDRRLPGLFDEVKAQATTNCSGLEPELRAGILEMLEAWRPATAKASGG